MCGMGERGAMGRGVAWGEGRKRVKETYLDMTDIHIQVPLSLSPPPLSIESYRKQYHTWCPSFTVCEKKKVQFKMVAKGSGMPICAPSRFSVSSVLSLKQF